MKKLNVLIVDDSAVVRQVLSNVLASDPAIHIQAAVADPIFAMQRMQKEWPDVVILDVEMPRMDGITFLKKIMQTRPTPVVICSSITTAGADTTMQALAAGAVDVVQKPGVGTRRQQIDDVAKNLIYAVKAAAQANMRQLNTGRMATKQAVPVAAESTRAAATSGKYNADVILTAANHALDVTTERVIAIGTSTGGTQALEKVLTSLPRYCPGIVVVQHMPEKFTAAFADRLNSLCEVAVSEAKHQDRVIPGRVLIAPGGKHLLLKRSGAHYYVDIVDGPPVNRHRPSVDVLFRSVAKYAGKNALGIIMTGMGDDGARGMKELYDTGAVTLAQDEHSCVVYGMPKEAIRLGGVQRTVSLGAIAGEIITYGSS